MIIRITVLVYLLLLHSLVYAQMNKDIHKALFYNRDVMVDSVKKWEVNNIQFSSIGYFLREENGLTFKKIVDFYKRGFSKMGYRIKRIYNKIIAGTQVSGLFIKNDKYFFNIQVKRDKEAGYYYVTLQASENRALKNAKIFKQNSSKDNPGFDYKDVPRFKKSIRILSSRNKSDSGVLEEQIIYRSQSEIKDITDFYKNSMNRNGWKIKQSFKTKDCSMLHFKQSYKICDIFIIKDKKLKKNLIVISRESNEKVF